ncbi:MAG TPA: hypothetical protein PLH72_18700 [Vicinamibacterales bacterium]|nr:hypothetical protein [Vicinamibacterales bacterium]
MTTYKTGRSTDYQGAEAPPKRQCPLRSTDVTAEAITQFERMARGLAPVQGEGSTTVWVVDSTLTPELREWCAETARQIEREAELAKRPRPKPKQGIGSRGVNRTKADIEAAVARVLARYPDAGVNQIVVMTGLQRPSVIASEAWAMAQMGQKVKHE